MVTRLLGVPVRLTAATRPLDPAQLTDAEACRWRSLPAGPRRTEWLLGRRALHLLLEVLGREGDSSGLSFPHPGLSLTHAGGIAVAAGVDTAAAGAGVAVCGLGVDYEPRRSSVDSRLARLFLDTTEQAWVDRFGARGRGDEIMRLWTVKEALFKATPDNRDVTVAAYAVEDPAATHGAARGPCPSASELGYASVDLPTGFLAVALCGEMATGGGTRVAR
jgi:4'-phosphopantetheinyl transferase EntD